MRAETLPSSPRKQKRPLAAFPSAGESKAAVRKTLEGYMRVLEEDIASGADSGQPYLIAALTLAHSEANERHAQNSEEYKQIMAGRGREIAARLRMQPQ